MGVEMVYGLMLRCMPSWRDERQVAAQGQLLLSAPAAHAGTPQWGGAARHTRPTPAQCHLLHLTAAGKHLLLLLRG
jgi:hypothetical protein